LTEPQRRALLAVQAGRVYQRHPMDWLVGLADLDTVRPATLQLLARERLIRVKISDAAPEHTFDRQVVVTPHGEQALLTGKR
jgi:hypothetical protein